MNDEISGGPNVFRPSVMIRTAKLISQDQGKRDLIHLHAATNWPAIHPGILRKAAVLFLLHIEEIIERAVSGSRVTHRIESSRDFIKIPRPNRVISTNRRFIRVRPAAPGNRR